MLPKENAHDCQHQDSIEDIEHILMRENPPIITHKILDNSEDASDKNDGAREVEHIQMLPPRDIRRSRQSSRDKIDAIMEQDSGDEKDPEEEDLDEQTDDDDFLPEVQQREASTSLDPSSSSLYDEGDAISRDEYLRQPFQSDDRVSFAFDERNDSSQDHVYRGCEEGGCDQDEQCLHDSET